MHQLIVSYLFAYKQCYLPGLGSLVITQKSAQNDFSSKTIYAPQQLIEFHNGKTLPDNFISFIGTQKNINIAEATDLLDQYCKKIQYNLNNNESFEIAGVGKFYVVAGKKIQFQGNTAPDDFMPAVQAERVIHPEAEHTILVGDKERTNIDMTDYFNEEEPVKKSYWWIWALILLCIAIAILLTYTNSDNNSGMFGSAAGIF